MDPMGRWTNPISIYILSTLNKSTTSKILRAKFAGKNPSLISLDNLWFFFGPGIHVGVSENRGTPKSSIFNNVFHYKPSILGFETPI